ncbi:Eukaryotic translation initiation factor 3 subunit G [Wickerhamiella sorbophila]|uniref:Eukaryotic translation initiation factor 3 subunit G n=1 Tax=Wickerhamiella sorbophila TaxID=45607 RepID=A0A2T0FG20_9ASCO|nr:Eukaryotic translation initiation factor 3 subunit G [Wickerhamiella sorbophila]PRT53943.1 Eukaryotic translation initiation factor 3 subunit G [Wickerhamiella sorbophila]
MATVGTLPAPVVTDNGDGLKTIVFYRLNEAGKKVKVTQKVRETEVARSIEGQIEARRQWACYRNKDAPAPSVEENVQLKLFPKTAKPEKGQDAAPPKRRVASIVCRTCQGDHYTNACPYKEKLGIVTEPAIPETTPGRYQPPTRGGMYAREERDDSATLRVSNLPDSINEDVLAALFGRNGRRIVRCHVARNKDTHQSRGFAFIAFDTRESAERAKQELHGKAIGHLVMYVDFPRK